MYAIIETGGKQYRVAEGDTVYVEKIALEEGSSYTFDKVLAVNDGSAVSFGTPFVSGAKVEATVVKQGKGSKVIIFKYKSKKDYRKKQGHRQLFTALKIEKIVK
jgi:large subunit ribosomal protein L21